MGIKIYFKVEEIIFVNVSQENMVKNDFVIKKKSD